jgi:hypothetical protein
VINALYWRLEILGMLRALDGELPNLDLLLGKN